MLVAGGFKVHPMINICLDIIYSLRKRAKGWHSVTEREECYPPPSAYEDDREDGICGICGIRAPLVKQAHFVGNFG